MVHDWPCANDGCAAHLAEGGAAFSVYRRRELAALMFCSAKCLAEWASRQAVEEHADCPHVENGSPAWDYVGLHVEVCRLCGMRRPEAERTVTHYITRSRVVHAKKETGQPMVCGVKASGYAVDLTTSPLTCAKCIKALGVDTSKLPEVR